MIILKVQFYGNLTEVVGGSYVDVVNVTDLDALKKQLFNNYPALSKLVFAIAVDNKIVRENVSLNSHSQVVFMPPFAGG